jgi:CMP/dCMP kinase
MPGHYEEVLTDIKGRDERDKGRAIAPLLQASDATLLDTSELSVDQAVKAAIEAVENLLSGR